MHDCIQTVDTAPTQDIVTKYATPEQALAAHVETCGECKSNAFGYCSLGFRLLSDAAGMNERNKGEQLLLPSSAFERPLTRMALKQLKKTYGQK